MAEESSHIGVARKQNVLGDITNRLPKKRLPLFPGKFLIANDTVRKREHMGGQVEGAGSRKRVLGESENIGKLKCRIDCVSDVCGTVVDNKNLSSSKVLDDECSKHLSSLDPRKVHETVILDCNAKPAEDNMHLDALHCANKMERFFGSSDNAHFRVYHPQVHSLGEAELRDSCISSISLPLRLERARDSLHVKGEGNLGYSETSIGEKSNIIQINAVAVQKCKLELDKSNGSIESVNLAENMSRTRKHLPNEPLNEHSEQGNSKAMELLRPKIGNIEEHENAQNLLKHGTNVEGDLVCSKACSCSFCLKAAYMWTDLLYQDSKGRLSEINKSRREARFLAGGSYTRDFVCRSVGNHKKIMGLGSDLMQRWRTLFLHTENALTCESARLQSNLLKLKELRESCKRDIEVISSVPSSEP